MAAVLTRRLLARRGRGDKVQRPVQRRGHEARARDPGHEEADIREARQLRREAVRPKVAADLVRRRRQHADVAQDVEEQSEEENLGFMDDEEIQPKQSAAMLEQHLHYINQSWKHVEKIGLERFGCV